MKNRGEGREAGHVTRRLRFGDWPAFGVAAFGAGLSVAIFEK